MKIDEIIGKYFLGKESKEELEILSAWKMESEANLVAIERLETYWKNYEEIKDYKEFNKDSAWDKISGKVAIAPAPETIKEMFPLWKIAAGLVILLGAMYFIKTGGEETTVGTSIVSTTEMSNQILEDGSQVWINAGSTANFSEFTKNDRNIELIEGEAYFKVEPMQVSSDKAHPFTVSVGDFNIEVIGTEFNIKYIDSKIEIYVNEGRVLVTNGSKKVYLSAGDFIIGNSATFSKKENANPNLISWKTNTLEFKNSQLADVVKDLSSHYKVDIQLQDGLDHRDCFLNTSFSNEKIEDVLSELKALFQISSHKSGNTIVIDKVNC